MTWLQRVVVLGLMSTALQWASTPGAAPQPVEAGSPGLSGVARLVEGHRCWTGPDGPDVMPTHAVVTLPGQTPKLAASAVGFKILEGARPGAIHAFCEIGARP